MRRLGVVRPAYLSSLEECLDSHLADQRVSSTEFAKLLGFQEVMGRLGQLWGGSKYRCLVVDWVSTAEEQVRPSALLHLGRAICSPIRDCRL